MTVQPSLPMAIGWTASRFPAADRGDRVERIVPLASALFVVGSHASQGGVWHSVDGAGWTLATDVPQLGTINGVELHGIARNDAGFVAAGANYAIDGASPVIWFSTDGDHWTDVTPTPNECLVLLGVTATKARFIAVGAVCRDDANGPRSDGISFASTDGVHWERGAPTDALTDTAIEDVTWTGSEAVGLGVNVGGWTETLVSADGLAWARIPDGTPKAPAAGRLVWEGDKLVAIGQTTDPGGSPHATVWWSADGSAWDQRIVGDVDTIANGIVFDGREWVLIGGVIQTETSIRPLIEWRSEDGLTWGPPRVIIRSDGGYLTDIAATRVGLIALGGVPASNGERIWDPIILRYGMTGS